jgi:acyl-coenzyme A synthetase/AMP-(fatty) acid ligase
VYFDAFARGAIDLRPGDVALSVSKMFFAYGLGNSLFFTLMAGSQAILHPGAPRPADIAELAQSHGATVLYSVPTFYAHLVGDGRREAFANLRVAVSAGEALMPSLLHRARDFLGCPVLDGLGSTEVGQTFVSNTLAAWRDGTIGRALPPYQVAVRDDDDRDAGAGRIGQLWVRGPTVLIEYLGRPDATERVKDGEWLCTGDRAEMDADGYLTHKGRTDDIEIVGGMNVAPMEIEAVLSAHPAVTEVAVAGVRDAGGATRLEAFVVAAPIAAPSDALATELVELVRGRMAPHKVPRAVHFLDALPRTATGKLRRFVLRAGGASLDRRAID